jgi:hypothetical protein
MMQHVGYTFARCLTFLAIKITCCERNAGRLRSCILLKTDGPPGQDFTDSPGPQRRPLLAACIGPSRRVVRV